MYEQKEVGSKYSKNYMVYIKKDGEIISPFHDIPIWNNGNLVAINEIPRFENGKFEINKLRALNPITQDVSNGKVRFVSNLFPFKGYPWNYGAIPQTYEDPNMIDKYTQMKGDNDPIDLIEIGSVKKKIGEVYECKVLGCLAMIDGGECDWKVLVIDVRDKNAEKLNDISDVEELYPNLLEMTIKWFRDYKLPNNKPQNKFAMDGKFLSKEVAMDVINEAHESWKKLISDPEVKSISKINRTHKINRLEQPLIINEEKEKDTALPITLDDYFYYDENKIAENEKKKNK